MRRIPLGPAGSLLLSVGIAPAAVAQRDIPITVQNISAEQLNQAGTRNVVEVLKSLDGVRTPVTTLAPGRSVQLRALDQGFRAGDPINVTWHRQQLVLIDGRRPDPACLADLDAMPADQCKTVEVIRAGAGAVYGVDAVNGVVNIITRTPEEMIALRPPTAIDPHRLYVGVDIGTQWFINLDKVACDKQVIPGLTECRTEVKSPSVGFTGEYRISDNFRAGARFSLSEYRVLQDYGITPGHHRVKAKALDLYALWQPPIVRRFQPYWFFGGTYWDNDSDLELGGTSQPSRGEAGFRLLGGGGGEFSLTDRAVVRAGLRGVYGGGRDADTNFGVSFGAGFRF